jgi:tetratricopeptide (TPR) repeat protein
MGRIPEGAPADRQAEPPPLTQFALRRRAAEWFALSRKPREAWKSLEDLSAQLSEFDLRCEAQDFDTAAVVLLEFDFDYLFLWGHYGLMTDLHQRLQGKITDPPIAENSVGNLGSAHYRIGRLEWAMTCYEEALRLSREHLNRSGEGNWLGNLGVCVSDMGQTARAVELYEQALQVHREVGDRRGEGQDLTRLGIESADTGRFSRALGYYTDAIKIARETGDLANLALELDNLGECHIRLGNTAEAIGRCDEALAVARDTSHRLIEGAVHLTAGALELFRQSFRAAAEAFETSIEVADDIGNAQLQGQGRQGAALASLFGGDPASARRWVEDARQYHYPTLDMQNSVVLGVICLRQRDLNVTQRAFTTAIDQADELLAMSPERYASLDAKAIALCGLALCGDTEQTIAARAAFRAARAITSAPGVPTGPCNYSMLLRWRTRVTSWPMSDLLQRGRRPLKAAKRRRGRRSGENPIRCKLVAFYKPITGIVRRAAPLSDGTMGSWSRSSRRRRPPSAQGSRAP